MAEEASNDVLMYFLQSGSDPLVAESTTVNVLRSDKLLSDFKPGRFFEVSEFSFTIRLKDKEVHDEPADAAKAGSYGRWRTMPASQLKPTPPYKADVEDFSFTRALDVASTQLLHHCMAGDLFTKAVLVKRTRTPAGIVLGMLRMEFKQVRIKSVTWADGELVRETCRFRFDAVDVSYVARSLDDTATVWPCKWEAKPNG